MAESSGKIVDLRRLLAERFPPTPITGRARLATGIAALDLLTGGGLPRGAITELISPHRSSGSASLLGALVRTAQAGRFFLGLIDGRNSFDPAPLGNTTLRHLLWLRCHNAGEAMKAADFLLRDGNFPLLVLDTVLNSPNELRKVPATSWYRLQRLAEPTSTALVVLSRRSLVGSARLKLVLENQWTLRTFAEENAFARLSFRIQRSHLTQDVAEKAG